MNKKNLVISNKLQVISAQSEGLKLYYEMQTQDPINLIQQYYLNDNVERQTELKFCLKKNLENKYISHIYLLNEKIYTLDELGLDNDCSYNKLTQIDISKRLSFKDAFQFIKTNNINGYCVISNLDIFYNDTINQLKFSYLHKEKCCLGLTRYEYVNKDNYYFDKTFIKTGWSQDSWILHSNYIVKELYETEHFSFNLGIPGCDNKILYLLYRLNFNLVNCPTLINIFHYHNTNLRNYIDNKETRIKRPYVYLKPEQIIQT
jgi:hypothetical protein